jgi:Zn-dependent protease with chaperone function
MLHSQADRLQKAVTSLKQQHYAEAIHILETFCQETDPYTKDYWQAQMWLVKAYQENNQTQAAIGLCRQMTTSPAPPVQAWAQRILPTLSPPPEPETAPTPAPSETPMVPLPPEAAEQLLKAGHKALRTKDYGNAVTVLEEFCQGVDPGETHYAQAQAWLVKAYKGNQQLEAARTLCQQLTAHENAFTQQWAEQFLKELGTATPAPAAASTPITSAAAAHPQPTPSPFSASSESAGHPDPVPAIPKAGRSRKTGVQLAMKGITTSLSLASGVTLSLLFGMVLVLSLSLLLISESENPTVGFVIAVTVTVLFNAGSFFLAPFFMDLIQGWLYGTRWVSLYDIERQSPEAGRVIRTVCQQKRIPHPRLGIIEDQNPTAFTYGSLPNSARLVVSQGLFTYLDDDEVAAVYAHELGHIVHWDFAIMTLASTLIQIVYLIYVYARELTKHLGNGEASQKVKSAAQTAALVAYIFYIVGEYLVLYLSRVREYYADHFAAETTGNPNALSRALVKISYGILEEGQRNPEPSKVIQGTRALGICDPRSAAITGTAYRVASEPQKVGRVFLWDMFNPWAWWMELRSTHPLTGKRVRALTTYAEQLGLETEFDMARVVREGKKLSKQRLYGNFIQDLIISKLDLIGVLLGLALGALAIGTIEARVTLLVSPALVGFGLGTLVKLCMMFPDFKHVPTMDVLTLMSDPYASPLRGRLVKLGGAVIGRGDAGNKVGSDLKLRDASGMIFLRYTSRFGPLGNALFGLTQADSFINRQVMAVGWFRRGVMPWIDLRRMDCPGKWTVTSHPRFWLVVLGVGSIVLGFVLM